MISVNSKTIAIAGLVFFFSGTVSAEVLMKYPFNEGATNTQDIYAVHLGPPPTAADIDTSSYPGLYAPISGTVTLAIDEHEDNKLTGSQLTAIYGVSCTPMAWAYGNTVIITAEDGTSVRLGHMRQGSVSAYEGKAVSAGDFVGEAGSSGRVCAGAGAIGDHLHIEYRDPNGVLQLPGSKLCDPIVYPSDDSGECYVGEEPPDDGCDPTVSSVSPLSAKLNDESVFTVIGSCLPQSLAFFIENCDALETLSITQTSASFSCTPKWSTGNKQGVVKDEPGGIELYSFQVNVLPEDQECECESGACCDGCFYRASNYVCENNADAMYSCAGNSCGDNATVSYRDRYCSGSSSSCNGSYSLWSGEQTHESCSNEETCVAGNPSYCTSDQMCMQCTDIYEVTDYECNSYSSANGSGPGGGEIMEVCGSVNQSGAVTVKVRKHDGTDFGFRPYQVRVSHPDGDPCGPEEYNFVISDSNPSGEGSSQLTFTFDSIWLQGQTEKGYCVTASTKPGDPGYDANNPQQESWWYSDKFELVKMCL